MQNDRYPLIHMKTRAEVGAFHAATDGQTALHVPLTPYVRTACPPVGIPLRKPETKTG